MAMLSTPSNQISTASKSISPSLSLFYTSPRRKFNPSKPNGGGSLLIRAYMEESTSISGFANKVIGALPVIGLVARILSDEGGVGGDIIDFAEFRRRVGNKCSVTDSRAFYDFQDRHGKKRAKLGGEVPKIPMEIRAEKALEAIYVCCFEQELMEEDDSSDLSVILNAVFPTVGQDKIDRIVKEMARRVSQGTDVMKIRMSKPLPKEAVQLQMKDLQFLRDGGDTT